MKKLIMVAALLGTVLAADAAEKWDSYTSDDFSQKLLFAEYWKVDNPNAVKSEEGRAVFNGKMMMIPKAKTPKKFRASVDIEVTKGSADIRCGTTISEVKAGEKKRVSIECEGAEEGFAPIRICGDGEGTIDNFEVLRAVDDAASPNLVVNGGMEYVEDGMPPYFKHGNCFNIVDWKRFDYRKYTKMCYADEKNPHSGKYSLKIQCNNFVPNQSIGVVRMASKKGAAGVFSFWAKSDRPGVEVRFNYAGVNSKVTLTNAWMRYEVVSTNLPAEAFFLKIANLNVIKPETMRECTAWIDDVQAEIIDPRPTADEIKSGKKFATPFRENDFDKIRFTEVVPHRAPTLKVPCLAKGVKASVKLDDWIGSAAKFGDFYNLLKPANHPTDAYIACDEEQIYIGIRAYGENFLLRSPDQERKHDWSGIFGSQRSSVEFMFDPTGDNKIWHLAFNDFGYWDAGENRNIKWDGDWTNQLVKNEEKDATDYFIALPWKYLKRFGLKDAFPLMVGRNDEAGGEFSVPYIAERGGFAGTYDWWPIAEFPPEIVAKYRLATDPDAVVAKTVVMPWLSFYMDEPQAKFRIISPDGKIEETAIDLKDMPLGTNTVTVAGTEQKVIKLPYRKHACQVNHWTRCLRKDGRNILHVGDFVGDSIFAWHMDKHKMIEMTDFLHEYCGHNYIQYLVQFCEECRYFNGRKFCALENCRLAMERARQNNMLVLVWTAGYPMDDPAKCRWITEQYTEFPNITSILAIDEPELGGMGSDACRDYLSYVRSFFPWNPVQMNNTTTGIPNNYADLNTDVLMLDNYITSGDQSLVDGIVKFVDIMMEKGAVTGKPCYYFIAGNNGHHYKEPTFDEQVAQSWGSICSGCTGLSFYESIPTASGAFEAFCQIPQEVAQVEDVLVSDELCGKASASVGWKDLRHLSKKLDGRYVMATCNIQKKPLENVIYTVPADFPQNGKIKVLFEERELDVKDGRFTDSYKPYERHVYEVR